MIIIMTIGAFFLLLVLVYPVVCIAIALYGILEKKKASQLYRKNSQIHRIDQATDRRKKAAFWISMVLTFFIVAPFIVLAVVAGLF